MSERLQRLSGWFRHPSNWVFVALFVFVLLCQLIVVWQSWFVNRLWEDEAFNLTVPLNLLRGFGYASDGALSGSELTLFDARISTGPAVLLPVTAVLAFGVDPVLGARFVGVCFYALLLAGLWLIAGRVAGKWASLLAVVVPATLHLSALPSPVQGPADILGEIPAAALIVWAFYLARRYPLWAGLVFGLAIQAKLIALLAAPALVVLVFFSVPGQRFWLRVRRVLWPTLLAMVPMVLFELAALVAMGSDYVNHVRQMWLFLRSGGQAGVATTAGDKLTALFSTWYLPLWVTVLLTVISLSLMVGLFVFIRRDRALLLRVPDAAKLFDARYVLLLSVSASLALLCYAGWWISSSHTPVWIRHPSIGLLAFVPILAAVVVLALRVWFHVAGRLWSRLCAVLVAGLFAVSAVVQLSAHVIDALEPEIALDLPRQRVVVDQLRTELAVSGADRVAVLWGEAVAIPVMAGVHVGLVDAGVAVVDSPRLLPGTWSEVCPVTTVSMSRYVFCDAPLTWADRP